MNRPSMRDRAKLRASPAFWSDMDAAWRDFAKTPLDAYVRYARWYAGDTEDVANTLRRATKTQQVVMVNMLNLVVRSTRSEMFFRAPRYYVKPVETLGNNVFTPQLARVETLLLNDFVEETEFFTEGRRVLMDMLLGPFGVFKVGYSANIAVDDSWVERELKHAQKEDERLLSGFKPKVKPTDYHAGHIERHELTLAMAERGDIKLPERLIEYLKKHIMFHREAIEKYGDRPKETVRYEKVFCRRRSPLQVVFDPWAETRNEREWVGERFLRPLHDVLNDPEYDSEERTKVSPVDSKSAVFAKTDSVLYGSQFTSSDERVLLYEIVDLRAGKVITYADGCDKALRVKPYKMQAIQPSGPYIDASFTEDVLSGLGVPPPAVYEAHQISASLFATIAAITAKRGVPRLAVDGAAFDQREMERMREFIPGAILPFKRIAGQKISEIVQQFPALDVPAQLLALEDRHKRAIEQFSGQGSARLGGGDTSRTATASSIISESTSNLSEDMASVFDDLISRTGRSALRHMRRFYKADKVAEIVGQAALKVWPKSWSTRDIVNDRGISVVPGSTGRRNTAIERKLHAELYTLVMNDPSFPPTAKQELLTRIFDLSGIQGLDLDGMAAEQIKQQLIAMLMQEAGQTQTSQEGLGSSRGGKKGPNPARSAKRRQGASTEPTRAAASQGAMNPGGGRVPTGASQGDKPRMMR